MRHSFWITQTGKDHRAQRHDYTALNKPNGASHMSRLFSRASTRSPSVRVPFEQEDPTGGCSALDNTKARSKGITQTGPPKLSSLLACPSFLLKMTRREDLHLFNFPGQQVTGNSKMLEDMHNWQCVKSCNQTCFCACRRLYDCKKSSEAPKPPIVYRVCLWQRGSLSSPLPHLRRTGRMRSGSGWVMNGCSPSCSTPGLRHWIRSADLGALTIVKVSSLKAQRPSVPLKSSCLGCLGCHVLKPSLTQECKASLSTRRMTHRCRTCYALDSQS